MLNHPDAYREAGKATAQARRLFDDGYASAQPHRSPDYF